MTDKTTDKNVILFPGRSQDGRGQTKEERKAELSEEQYKKSNAWFRRAVEEQFASMPMVHSKEERIRLAKNLWQILSDLPPSVLTRDILHAAGQGGETESTKRLPYFALKPDLSPSEQNKRAEKLTKTIKKYTRIVTEAARKSHRDESDLIRRFVAGTRYWPLTENIDATDNIDVEAWADVETAIQTAAARISSKYNLPRFFKLVHDLGIGTNWKRVRWDTQNMFPPELVYDSRLPLRPSVYLGEIRVCKGIPCTIYSYVYDPEDDDELSKLYGRYDDELKLYGRYDDELKLYGRLRKAGLDYAEAEGVASPVLRASLELLPMGRQNAITPILLLKSWTYLAFAEDFDGYGKFGGPEWRAYEIFDGFSGPIEKVAEGSEEHSMEEPGGILTFVNIQAEFKSGVGSSYVNSLHSKSTLFDSWILRLDDSARISLSKQIFVPRGEYKTKDGLWNLDFDPTGDLRTKGQPKLRFPWRHVDGLTSFPDDTMAALLERSLFHAPEAARLDDLLDENTRILTQELDEKIGQARARRHERLDELRRE
jgi:hypothetical protein